MVSNTENDKNKPIPVLRVQTPLDECQLFSYCSFMLLWNTHGPIKHIDHMLFYYWIGAAKSYEDV